MRVVCWWWWVPGCRPQSYCHICLISYLSFCVLAQSLPRCLLLLSPHITCQSIDSYFSYAVPQGSGHTILHAGLKESWSYTNKCKQSSQHSTENTLLNLWKDKKNPNIKCLIWVTPTCAKCYDMWEEPGLGRAGLDHHRGRDHAPMCWPTPRVTPGCRGHQYWHFVQISLYFSPFPPANEDPT